MSIKAWEKTVLAQPGAAERVGVIEDELRLAAGLTALREEAGLSQHDLAGRLGVTQPRVAEIEKSRNVTIDVIEQYVSAVGGELEVTVRKGNRRFALIAPRARSKTSRSGPGRAAPRPVAEPQVGYSSAVVSARSFVDRHTTTARPPS